MTVNIRRRRNECVSVTDIHICTGNMHVTSSINPICVAENLFVYNVWGIMLP